MPQMAMSAGLDDIQESVRRWPLWVTLGWHDILIRYRRTVLGPIWNSLTTAIAIAGLGLVYSKIFRQDVGEFLPYLTGGMITWYFISGMVNDGCVTFVNVATVMKNIRLPVATHAFRITFKNLLMFLHNIPVLLFVAFLFQLRPNAATLLFVPGLLLTCLTGAWVALSLGVICARFRDLVPMITSLLTVAFFVTPVVWDRGMLGEHQYIAFLNPFTHFVAILRDPMIGRMPPTESWVFCASTFFVGWLGTISLFARARSRIVFWV